jgi:AAA+ superfamily predicted ATPase
MTQPISALFATDSFEHLTSELFHIETLLRHALDKDRDPAEPKPSRLRNLFSFPEDSTVNCICNAFSLTPFERDVLLLCVAVDLYPAIADLCAQLQGTPLWSYPTINLALSVLENPSLRIFDQNCALFRWRLISRGEGHLSNSFLRVDPWVVQYLMGYNYTPPEYVGALSPAPFSAELSYVPESYEAISNQLCALWSDDTTNQIVQLWGSDSLTRQQIVAETCTQLDWELFSIDLDALSNLYPPALRAWLLWWQRRALLAHHVLLLNYDDPTQLDLRQKSALTEIRKTLITPLILSGNKRLVELGDASLTTLNVQPLSAQEQLEVWKSNLGEERPPELEDYIAGLSLQFNLNAATIQSICQRTIQALQADGFSTMSDVNNLLWHHCRTQSRDCLEELAERVELPTTAQDLVLADDVKKILHQVVVTVRNRSQVFGDWQMSSRRRGIGIMAMLHGPSGTGKTMAAEWMAYELGLDLYRIDFDQIASQDRSETQRNTRKVFDEAEASGAILLFEEADSIFGKRSQTGSLYPYQDVSYLMQQVETYSGLVILTTHSLDAIDPAVLRRLQFSAQFKEPDLEQRLEIWNQIFPWSVPTQNVLFKSLAQLNLSGASIQNVALGAAFLAAEELEPVQMQHLFQAAQTEYMRLGRTITDDELRNWYFYTD